MPPRITPVVHNLSIPQFIHGPNGSWVVPAQAWALSSMWDMVVVPQLFVPLPTNGPAVTRTWRTLNNCFYTACMHSCHGTQTSDIDPCYFFPLFLPLECMAVAVLSTIKEDRLFKLFPTHNAKTNFCDVGVQMMHSDLKMVWDSGFEDGVQADKEGNKKYSFSFVEVGVQTSYSLNQYLHDVLWCGVGEKF